MIHTKAGYMTKEEAKMIGDLDRDLKKKKAKHKTKPIKK
jgi:hypothetical protein